MSVRSSAGSHSVLATVLLVGVIVFSSLLYLRSGQQMTVAVGTNECNDGIDNEGDGLIDMADPGCQYLQSRNVPGPWRERNRLDLGMNANTHAYWSGDWLFVDVMKQGAPWAITPRMSGSPWSYGPYNGPHDPQGYPLDLTDLSAQGKAVRSWPLYNSKVPGGVYTLLFDGSGSVSINISQVFTQNGGKGLPRSVTIPASFDSSGIQITILESDPKDHVRNIRLIMPGFASTYETQPFHPLYLKYLKNFSIYRSMDLGNINSGAPHATDWSTRVTPDYYSQATGSGVALEYHIQIANAIHADLWINVPDSANDNYIRQMATMIRDNLNPGLKVWVEYSNETWNWNYTQWHWIEARAREKGIDHTYMVADLDKHAWDIFRDVYGERQNDVVRVAASQMTGGSIFWSLVDRLMATADPNDPHKGFDVLSAAPYYGPRSWLFNDKTTTDDIIDATQYPGDSDWIGDADYATQQRYKTILGRVVPLYGYESGYGADPGTTKSPWYQAYLGTQNHPRMFDVYRTYLDRVFTFSHADGINQFNYVQRISQYGPWGAMEWIDNIDNEPKMRALIQYASIMPVDIQNVRVSLRTRTGFSAQLVTAPHAVCRIEYDTNAGGSYGYSTPFETVYAREHTLTVSGLQQNQLYHFRVTCKGLNDVLVSSGDFTALTDTTPAQITSTNVLQLTAQHAVISVQTDRSTPVEIRYGFTDTYTTGGSVVSDVNFSTGHTLSLAPLNPDTLYHFRVFTKDPSTDVVSSKDFTFRTAPISSRTIVLDNTDTQNFYADYEAAGGTTIGGYKGGAISAAKVRLVKWFFSVKPGVPYAFSMTWPTSSLGRLACMTVDVKDAATGESKFFTRQIDQNNLPSDWSYGNVLWKSMGVFVPTSSSVMVEILASIRDCLPGVMTIDAIALDPQQPFSLSAVAASPSGEITWMTDVPSSSLVEYGTTTDYELSVTGDSSATNHSVRLSNLLPGTTYHYRVRSVDAQGNMVGSDDKTFTAGGVVNGTTCSPLTSSSQIGLKGIVPVYYFSLEKCYVLRQSTMNMAMMTASQAGRTLSSMMQDAVTNGSALAYGYEYNGHEKTDTSLPYNQRFPGTFFATTSALSGQLGADLASFAALNGITWVNADTVTVRPSTLYFLIGTNVNGIALKP